LCAREAITRAAGSKTRFEPEKCHSGAFLKERGKGKAPSVSRSVWRGMEPGETRLRIGGEVGRSVHNLCQAVALLYDGARSAFGLTGFRLAPE